MWACGEGWGVGGMTPQEAKIFRPYYVFGKNFKNFQTLFNENFDDGAENLTQFTLISIIEL